MAENAHRFRVDGLSPVFQIFYIQVWNKYDTLVPHPAYIYFIKMPANPDNPSRFVFFLSMKDRFSLSFKTSLRSIQNALAFKVKRPCVSSQTHLRFRLNALAFFLPADLFKSSKWFSVGFICMSYSLRGEYFKYNHL